MPIRYVPSTNWIRKAGSVVGGVVGTAVVGVVSATVSSVVGAVTRRVVGGAVDAGVVEVDDEEVDVVVGCVVTVVDGATVVDVGRVVPAESSEGSLSSLRPRTNMTATTTTAQKPSQILHSRSILGPPLCRQRPQG